MLDSLSDLVLCVLDTLSAVLLNRDLLLLRANDCTLGVGQFPSVLRTYLRLPLLGLSDIVLRSLKLSLIGVRDIGLPLLRTGDVILCVANLLGVLGDSARLRFSRLG